MITNLETAATPTTGIRKAAILMVTLGDHVSAEILKQLEEDEVEEIGREIARMTAVSAEQGESVLEEFYEMTVAHDYVLRGGVLDGSAGFTYHFMQALWYRLLVDINIAQLRAQQEPSPGKQSQ